MSDETSVEKPARFYATEPLPEGSVFRKCGEDFTMQAKDMDPAEFAGREAQLDQIIRILGRRTKANPVILGDAGVGKTFLVRCLAWKIVQRQVPAWLAGRKVIRTSFFDIHAATGSAGYEFNAYMRKLKEVLEEATNTPVVLFLDELHTLRQFEVSNNVIRPYLAEGRLKLIGATTTEEFHRLLGREDALLRRFQPVFLPEPDGPALSTIIASECRRLAGYYSVAYDPGLPEYALRLANEYLPFRRQPDKTIDILEQAFVNAAAQNKACGEPEARTAITELTGIPDPGLAAEHERTTGLERALNARVLGQEEVIHTLCRRLMVTRNRMQLNPERPLAAFLCTGPSGVGKTELAKALARFTTGSEDNLVRIDMSVHKTLFSLLGRPGGGTAENPDFLPPLTMELRRRPFGVLLLDEFEKAEGEVWLAFLQAFDYGRLTDLQGNVLHLGAYVVLMTCNIGFEKGAGEDTRVFGFTSEAADNWRSMASEARKAVEAKFRKEFLGRLDGVLVFRPLNSKVVEGLIRQKTQALERLIGKKLELEPGVVELVRGRGFSRVYGARPLNGAIDSIIGQALAELKMTEAWQHAKTIRISLEGETAKARVKN